MYHIVKSLLTLFLTISLCLSLLFVEKKHTHLVCKDIKVAIKAYPGQTFITAQEIVDLLQSNYAITLGTTPLKKIDIYTIQNQLKKHPLIKSILVYKTWDGILNICLESKYFIARTIGLMEPKQIYVDEQGALLALKVPLRLLVITGKNIITEKKQLAPRGLLTLLHYIHKDAFWRRQITSLEVEDDGKMILGTQLGGHKIEFGKAEKIEEKFEKLRLFYSQVIPYKGWRAYHRINLAFENQIICE